MTNIYDVIILGATPEGLALAEQIAIATKTKVAIISTNFIYKTKKQNCIDIEFIQATGVFLSYIHGHFDLTVLAGDSQNHFYSKRIVLATGTKPIKTNLKNVNISYKALDLSGKHKTDPVVVYGDTEEALKYALDLSRRFGYVYLCTKNLELPGPKKLQKKLNETANIVHLPKCKIVSCKNNKEGQLIEVILDVYTAIKTHALVVSIGRLPDFPPFTKKFIKQTIDGFADVTNQHESKLVPKFYVIGDLCEKFTKKDLSRLATLIELDIGELTHA